MSFGVCYCFLLSLLCLFAGEFPRLEIEGFPLSNNGLMWHIRGFPATKLVRDFTENIFVDDPDSHLLKWPFKCRILTSHQVLLLHWRVLLLTEGNRFFYCEAMLTNLLWHSWHKIKLTWGLMCWMNLAADKLCETRVMFRSGCETCCRSITSSFQFLKLKLSVAEMCRYYLKITFSHKDRK